MPAVSDSNVPAQIAKPHARRGRRVLIIQIAIKHYRQAFYSGLQEALSAHDVELRVAHSLPHGKRAIDGDVITLDPSTGFVVPARTILGNRLVYQNVWKHILWADLIIVEQAAKYVANYPLFLASALGLKKLGSWGHGWNHELPRDSLSERIKRVAVPRCDWWFAYTQGVARYVTEQGMAPDRISVVENTVDTQELVHQVEDVSGVQLSEFRSAHNIPRSAKLAVFSGTLDTRKHMPFLLETAQHIKARLPEFHLAVIGEGPDASLVREAARENDWVHALGATFGTQKAICFRAADVFLCPGVVGLAILDAFAAGLPFITSDLPIHSPEVEYLENNVNGLYLPFDRVAFGDAVADLLADQVRLDGMKAEAIRAARERPMSRMVGNFSQGILRAVGLVNATEKA